MTCTKMFLRSFSRRELKQFRYWAHVGFFILSLSFFILVKPYFGSIPILNFQLSMDTAFEIHVFGNTNSSQRSISGGKVIEKKQICNVSDPKFDFCDVAGDVRIHGMSSKIFAVLSQKDDLVENGSWNIRPYPRKANPWMMTTFITEFSVNATVGHEQAPNCTLNHSVPAVVFSAGGYAAVNHFHAFTDILVPLYAASAKFHGEVQFLITNLEEKWKMKYEGILKQLSRYEIIHIDTDDKVHCFPHMIVGLKHYMEMRIDAMTASKGYSMKEFRKLMRNAYSLKKLNAIKILHDTQEKPKLLIITRNETRKFLNADQVAELAIRMGFEVVISEALENLDEFSHIVNSCDVMMGLHGAGLTNLVFLPTNAILLQVVPWGNFEWMASNCFGDPALDMELKYMEYRIKEEESSLIKEYPIDHMVFRDPDAVHHNDWDKFKSIYLDKQDVIINVNRFNATLLKALELLHH
ncbi:hypothetical protein NE237_007083 [Protea cynaroides]|uniref:Glycosyltransferase 61 catalytic domain-containing protein n=1 Tax=Protea cynaroides TaxID=273540 RepID=A0A9Q0KNU4_9MAGN|nr:hypothetical protein NE237_007083 [Protea cynaroides]